MAEGTIYYDLLRPMAQPSAHVPIGAHSTGHYRLTRPFTCTIKTNPFVQLFWCSGGSGTIMFQDEARTLKAGDIAIYLPGMRHHWFSDELPWDFRWMAIDGPLAESLTVSLGLNAGIYKAGTVPIQLFKQLEKSIRRPTKQGERKASSLVIQILILASACQPNLSDPLAHDVLDHIHHCWNKASLNVASLAAVFHVHRSVLTRRFKKMAGTSPIQYINRVRMQNVLLLLQQTEMTIDEIAAHCGYHDANYISRLTHRLTGKSPRQYRLSHKTTAPEPKGD